MLVLSLMSNCDNNCSFCCVKKERAEAKVIPLSDLKLRMSKYPSTTPIDFFGGEPTLYPWFFEALTYARLRGHKCSIATNGRGFSNKEFTNKISQYGVESIRTSIYGHNETVHDFHTCARGSFKDTVQGFNNILDAGINLFVNTVITNRNFQYLENVADLLIDLGVKNVKFGTLVDASHCKSLVPNNAQVRPYLEAALDKYHTKNINCALEKSTLCLVPKYSNICAYEPDNRLYNKVRVCNICEGHDRCVGLPIEQISKFGDTIALPLTKKPLKEEPTEILANDKPHFVKWDDLANMSLTAIIKLTSKCNLNCNYCYAKRNFNNKSMPTSTALKAIDQLEQTGFGRIDINWHGGEPLLFKKEDLQDIINYEHTKLSKKTTVNRLQTNGTLIDPSWIKIFRETRSEIGISLDGPDEVHNANRLFRNQKGSHNKAQEGVLLTARENVPIELLCVLSPSSKGNGKKIFEYFDLLAKNYPNQIASVNFSPSFEVNTKNNEIITSTISPADFAETMIDIFNSWFDSDNENLNVPFFSEIISVFLGGEASMCQFKRGCTQFITIEPDGSAYPCDRFSGLEDFYLGNILTNSIEELLTSEKYQKYVNCVYDFNTQCNVCEWFKICNSGCLYESYIYSRKSGMPSYYCVALRKIFSHIDQALGLSLEDYQRFKLQPD